MSRWLSRLLWMTAQAAAIGGMTWLSFRGDAAAERVPAGMREIVFAIVMWTILVAFATACITRLWDWSVLALARRRAGMRQGQKSRREELSVQRAVPRVDQRAQVGQGRRVG